MTHVRVWAWHGMSTHPTRVKTIVLNVDNVALVDEQRAKWAE